MTATTRNICTPMPEREAPAARIPLWHVITSMLGLGPIPFTQIINTLALVAEANRNAQRTDTDGQLTAFEAVVRSRAIRRAQRWLDRFTNRTIEPLIRLIKAEHAEIQWLGDLIAQLHDASMMGPAGEQLHPAEAKQNHNMLRERTNAETRNGSTKHTVARRHPVRDILMLALDFPVFLFAMLGLLNVNLRLVGTDFAATLKCIIAFLFALLGTVLVAVVMRRLGRRHRAYKGSAGRIQPDHKNIPVVGELIGTAIVIAIVAGVMANRVYLEGENAHAPLPLTIALAALFATLIGFTAYLNYRAEFDNGSTDTDHLQHLSRQIRGREQQTDAHKMTRTLKLEQAGVNTTKLTRALTNCRSTASKMVTTSTGDRAIQIARSYADNPRPTVPEPALDYTRLELAESQARQLTTHQHKLETDMPTYSEDLFSYLTEN